MFESGCLASLYRVTKGSRRWISRRGGASEQHGSPGFIWSFGLAARDRSGNRDIVIFGDLVGRIVDNRED